MSLAFDCLPDELELLFHACTDAAPTATLTGPAGVTKLTVAYNPPTLLLTGFPASATGRHALRVTPTCPCCVRKLQLDILCPTIAVPGQHYPTSTQPLAACCQPEPPGT